MTTITLDTTFGDLLKIAGQYAGDLVDFGPFLGVENGSSGGLRLLQRAQEFDRKLTLIQC